ncbi:DUF1176 domain-containing protein [Agrilutibacter solisilvae]|uniref:DUF1176 domain-containing protein n=1 Tax=Agrilutibacter solisilvae TaxID=2763317 RepID=A0A975ARN5_9GAMM|nr:DUF1176 domain-containing protein [Lysobacter solisilvae]QSX77214.1 DUF1176 domain-containing protein [Lysobacter solisilvae]
MKAPARPGRLSTQAARLAAAIALTAWLPASAATPVHRQFADWTVTCDNGLRCVALGAEEDGGRLLSIERDAGPHAAPRVELIGAAGGFVDATPLRFPAPAWSTDDAGDFQSPTTSDLAATQRFIDAIRNGRRLRPGADAQDGGIPLRGLSAALLLIDELQGRLDTRGALLRRGERGDERVPAAPALPVLQAAPPPAPLADADATALVATVRRLQADTLAQEDCYEATVLDQAWALTDTQALVQVGCLMGAYQGSGLLFQVARRDASSARRLQLPSVPGEPAMTMLTSADYDPATGQLAHYAKGRGLGDCGETAQWIFDGKRFQLAQYASMERCAGAHADHWPTRWRSRVAGGTP